jgi:hypothetical protein
MLFAEAMDMKTLEKLIEREADDHTAQSLALWGIWKRRLYRKDYKTFKRYMKQRWGRSASFGYQVIGQVDSDVGQYFNINRCINAFLVGILKSTSDIFAEKEGVQS